MPDQTLTELNGLERAAFLGAFRDLDAAQAFAASHWPRVTLRRQGDSHRYCGGLAHSYVVVVDFALTADDDPEEWRVDSLWILSDEGREVRAAMGHGAPP